MSALGGDCPMTRRRVSRNGSGDVTDTRDQFVSRWEPEMYNIFAIIGVVVVVLFVVGYLGIG
jgi:hypothetical protein